MSVSRRSFFRRTLGMVVASAAATPMAHTVTQDVTSITTRVHVTGHSYVGVTPSFNAPEFSKIIHAAIMPDVNLRRNYEKESR